MIKKITRIYLFSAGGIILAQSFFFATYQLFLLEHHLSYLQINLINLAYMASCFILEIPTGAYADVFGRRKSIIIGCLILSLSFLIYFLSPNFWIFVLAEIIGAFGSTFISGALEAWMVDSLKRANYTGDLEKIYEKEGRYRLVGLMLGSLSGAWLGSFNLSYPWLASALGMLIVSIYIHLALPKNGAHHKQLKFNFRAIHQTAHESVQYGYRHRGLFYLIGFGACLALSFQAFNMQWPIVFSGYGLSVAKMGWIFNAIALTNFLGTQLARPFLKIVGRKNPQQEKHALIWSQAITAIGMALAASGLGLYPVLNGFLLHEVGRGLWRPLKQAYLNRRINDEQRATVLSFDSMISQLGAGLGLLLSGYLADSFSISWAWLASALLVFVSIFIFSRLKNGK
ncbi:MAG: MFS transporter [Patescibacteria group bacterium]